MATGSIDLQRGPQIKPQDKRRGKRTMEAHSGPHGKRMTTGRYGRTTTDHSRARFRKEQALTRAERRNVQPIRLGHTTREPTVVLRRARVHPGEKISTGTQITILAFLFLFFSSPLFLNLFLQPLPPNPFLARPQTMKKINMCTR